jgi:hypothetical protein
MRLEEDVLVLLNGKRLKAGDLVTIDPMNGFLWKGEKKGVCSSEDIKNQFRDARGYLLGRKLPQVAFHVEGVESLIRIRGKEDVPLLSKELRFGLWRTEKSLKQVWGAYEGDLFQDFLKGNNPPVLQLWERDSLHYCEPTHYRMVDIKALWQTLPDAIWAEINEGKDHKLNSKTLEFREKLYAFQISNAFGKSARDKLHLPSEKIIIFPDIHHAEELRRFAGAVEKKARERGYKGYLKYGAMIENTAALKNIEGLAKLSHVLCFGTNDLTREKTGIARSSLYRKRESCFNGSSPFSVLTKDLIQELNRSMLRAHRANPSVICNMCGKQTDGSDASSIIAAARMGADMLTIPYDRGAYMKTIIALAMYHQQQELSMQSTLSSLPRGVPIKPSCLAVC